MSKTIFRNYFIKQIGSLSYVKNIHPVKSIPQACIHFRIYIFFKNVLKLNSSFCLKEKKRKEGRKERRKEGRKGGKREGKGGRKVGGGGKKR